LPCHLFTAPAAAASVEIAGRPLTTSVPGTGEAICLRYTEPSALSKPIPVRPPVRDRGGCIPIDECPAVHTSFF
jgi:hypothetical protein